MIWPRNAKTHATLSGPGNLQRLLPRSRRQSFYGVDKQTGAAFFHSVHLSPFPSYRLRYLCEFAPFRPRVRQRDIRTLFSSTPISPCSSNSIFCHPGDWHNAWQAMIPRKSLAPFNEWINALFAKKIHCNGGYATGIKRSVSVFSYMNESFHTPTVWPSSPSFQTGCRRSSYRYKPKKFSSQLRTVSEVLLTRNQPQPDLTAFTDSH